MDQYTLRRAKQHLHTLSPVRQLYKAIILTNGQRIFFSAHTSILLVEPTTQFIHTNNSQQNTVRMIDVVGIPTPRNIGWYRDTGGGPRLSSPLGKAGNCLGL